MKWTQVQKPLREGHQAFRAAWPESRYVEMTEGGRVQEFWESPYNDFLEQTFEPSDSDLEADDWMATGVGGE